jgi:predicted SAM-dependent methyltransferase
MRVNLGSGQAKLEGYINVDNRADMNPDVCCNVIEGLPFGDSSVDEVRAFDFLEHIPLGSTVKVVEEIYRVLNPGGLFDSHTPDAEHGQGAFQDPFHLSFWVKNSWLYFSDDLFRSLYRVKAKFRIDKIQRIPEKVTPDMDIYHLRVLAVAIK